jgi:hypothetical protein
MATCDPDFDGYGMLAVTSSTAETDRRIGQILNQMTRVRAPAKVVNPANARRRTALAR